MLKLGLSAFMLLISFHAQSAIATPVIAPNALKTGDILLQSVPCYVCSLIEIEEKSPYSHAGIVIQESSQTSVLEAFQKVERISLIDFLAKTKRNTRVLVLRPIHFNQTEITFSTPLLLKVFFRNFSEKTYDDSFSWTNFDQAGEKFYCSEFVVKFLNLFLPTPFETKPMHFQSYRQDWIRYFGKTPPDGEPGFSPGDFERSKLLKVVGTLE